MHSPFKGVERRRTPSHVCGGPVTYACRCRYGTQKRHHDQTRRRRNAVSSRSHRHRRSETAPGPTARGVLVQHRPGHVATSPCFWRRTALALAVLPPGRHVPGRRRRRRFEPTAAAAAASKASACDPVEDAAGRKGVDGRPGRRLLQAAAEVRPLVRHWQPRRVSSCASQRGWAVILRGGP